MNTVTVYFWKEWREQRGTLGILSLALLCGVGVVSAILPRTAVQDPITFQVAIGFTIVATVMSIGSDLLARERQLGTIAFLERMPGGLGTAFRAKLGFFVAALIVAACYGALLALCMSLARTGHAPLEMIGSAPTWLIVATIAVSLWAFAVSAWMPSGTLTIPATVLFLALFAWPCVRTATGDPLFHATRTQSALFAALCILGAPASAWASFVLGARRGRSRRTAAVFGLSTAALFFAPVWAWAGMRYVSMKTAPFEIAWGTQGSGGRYAFLDVSRRAPEGSAPRTLADERFSAVIVDLEHGGWRRAGDIDASAFVEDRSFARRSSLLGSEGCPRFELQATDDDAPARIIDGRTACELPVEQSSLDLALGPTPEDFGVHPAPSAYSIRWAGLGQALSFHEGDRGWVHLFRDPIRNIVVDRATIFSTLDETDPQDVRVRRGRWLALYHRRWIWFDPVSRKTEPLTCIAADEKLGPALDDGRFLLFTANALCVLDPDTGARVALETIGQPEIGRLTGVSTSTEWSGPPISATSATVVLAHASHGMMPALIDPASGVLRLAKMDGHARLQWFSVKGHEATVIEEGRRVIRYDFDRDRRDVLFSVDELE